MTNELSTERAIETLYTVRAYYASLTAGYPKGKDRRGIGDVMCSEIANSCLKAIQALEQQPCEDCISKADIKTYLSAPDANGDRIIYESDLDLLPLVTPQRPKGKWIGKYISGATDYEVLIKQWQIAKCNKCGKEYKTPYTDCKFVDYAYCPNCGADMSGGEEDV